ncbi:hypothetical protein E4U55_007485 [Claviceps digitariae]|nr:hypothetical protein E4U55_007485 [Claviceps digitariae]
MTQQAPPTGQRVFVQLSRSHRHHPGAWEDSSALIDAAIAFLHQNGIPGFDPSLGPLNPRLLVKENWGFHIRLVFDVSHPAYDPATAHLQGVNDLPGVMVEFSKRRDYVNTSRVIADKVNQTVREIHDSNGYGSEPPFAVDYTTGRGPTYWRPRSCCKPPESWKAPSQIPREGGGKEGGEESTT